MSLWSKPINLRASKSSPFCPRSPTSSVHSEISTEWARQNEVHGSSLNGTVTGKKPPTNVTASLAGRAGQQPAVERQGNP